MHGKCQPYAALSLSHTSTRSALSQPGPEKKLFMTIRWTSPSPSLHPLTPRRVCLEGGPSTVHAVCQEPIRSTLRLLVLVSYVLPLLASYNVFLTSTSIRSDSAVLVSCMVVQELVGTPFDHRLVKILHTRPDQPVLRLCRCYLITPSTVSCPQEWLSCHPCWSRFWPAARKRVISLRLA
jgi:hypothetical protein